MRENFFARGEIKTIDQDIGYDPETGDDHAILINPASIGAMSMDQSFGRYWMFPRQIEGVKLSTELPSYLRPEQVEFVGSFYTNQ